MPARMMTAMLAALLIPIPAYAQDVNSQFIEAAKRGDTVSIKALLETGANVNTTDINDRTALMWAAQKGHTETAQALLEAGADVNAWDRVYETPVLGWAAEEGHTETVQALLDAGADVNAKTEMGVTALTGGDTGRPHRNRRVAQEGGGGRSDPLRDDPRFHDLLRRMNLDP